MNAPQIFYEIIKRIFVLYADLPAVLAFLKKRNIRTYLIGIFSQDFKQRF